MLRNPSWATRRIPGQRSSRRTPTIAQRTTAAMRKRRPKSVAVVRCSCWAYFPKMARVPNSSAESPTAANPDQCVAQSSVTRCLRDEGTESRQDGLGIGAKKAFLIRTWRVEDQMPESHINVVADGLDMLVRVGRDDPTRGSSLRRQCVRQALHLKRIIDPHLLLRRQRECGPMARLLASSEGIRVKGHLHFDHHVDLIDFPAALGCSLRDCR